MTAVRMAATKASGMPSKPAASAASNQNSGPRAPSRTSVEKEMNGSLGSNGWATW